jgi:hypothetical protein
MGYNPTGRGQDTVAGADTMSRLKVLTKVAICRK